METTIRNEEIKDHQQVSEILRATFPTDAESQLVDALRESGKAVISLVAVKAAKEDEVLGHILFSSVSTSPPSEMKGIGLAPVAVKPEYQGQGIGSQLIRAGLELCRELHFEYVVVLGSPAYYGRFGFKKASQFGLQNEYGVDDEFMVIQFMMKTGLRGLIQYEPTRL